MRVHRAEDNELDPTIPIVVECSPPVIAALDVDETQSIERSLQTEIGALLRRLGLAGNPVIEVRGVTSNRAVRVRAHGKPQPYPPALMRRVWHALAPVSLRDLPDGAESTGRPGFPDQWFTSYLTGSTSPLNDPSSDLLSRYLSRLVYAVIQERPASLAGQAQISAYLKDGGKKLTSSIRPSFSEALSTILGSLLDMGVSVKDKPMVLQAIGASQQSGRSVEDILEGVFAQLRSGRIEIHVHPKQLQSLALGQLIETPLSVYADVFDTDLHDLFRTEEQYIFSETGIRLPDLVWVPSRDVTGSMFAVKVDEYMGPQAPGLELGEPMVDASFEPSNAATSGQPTANLADLVSRVGKEIIRTAGRLLDVGHVEYQLAQLGEAFPDLVRAATELYSVEDLTRVLRGLVSEQLSIRDMRGILERMLQYDTIYIDSRKLIVLDDRLALKEGTPPKLVYNWESYREFVRKGLKYYINYKYAQAPSTLYAYSIDPQLETYLDAVVKEGQPGGVRTIVAEDQQETVLDAVWSEVGEMMSTTSAKPAILTESGTRSTLRNLIVPELPDVPVLSYSELAASLDVQLIGKIDLM